MYIFFLNPAGLPCCLTSLEKWFLDSWNTSSWPMQRQQSRTPSCNRNVSTASCALCNLRRLRTMKDEPELQDVAMDVWCLLALHTGRISIQSFNLHASENRSEQDAALLLELPVPRNNEFEGEVVGCIGKIFQDKVLLCTIQPHTLTSTSTIHLSWLLGRRDPLQTYLSRLGPIHKKAVRCRKQTSSFAQTTVSSIF